jgi:hypothetical protein
MGLGKENKVTGSRLRGTGRHHLKEVKASEQDVEGGQAHADRKWREGRRTRTGCGGRAGARGQEVEGGQAHADRKRACGRQVFRV